MLTNLGFILGGFTAPVNIGTTPGSMLWLFPLLASVALIYKATKLPVITLGKFVKEVVILFCTISVVMILAAIGLNIVVYLITN